MSRKPAAAALPSLPLAYVARNLWLRRVTTALTALGMALVVYTFATVLMMGEGVRQSLVATGQPGNVILLRKGAGAEISSGIGREQAAIIEAMPGIAQNAQGLPMVSKETVVLNALVKRSSGKPSNVTMRGTSAAGMALRNQVRLTAGRMFRAGTPEVVVGRSVQSGFVGAELGEALRFGGREWRVVGVFDAGGSAFDSEIWGDSELMLQSFRRNAFSVVLVRLADPAQFKGWEAALARDARLTLDAKPETQFYEEQSQGLVKFITILGTVLSVIFSIGAVVGAMITMFAAVAQRTGEIGTLRALGFPRGAVLRAFLLESLLLSFVGGVLGLLAASGMQFVQLSTTNFQTFAELAFTFALTPGIVLSSLLFALGMGVVGGFIPAWRAARLPIVDALRAA